MTFEDWWEENYWAIDDGSEAANTIKVYSESAWQASRENQTECPKNEFCRAVGCKTLTDGTCSRDEMLCGRTAKQFHHWLLDNGYRIVKG